MTHIFPSVCTGWVLTIHYDNKHNTLRSYHSTQQLQLHLHRGSQLATALQQLDTVAAVSVITDVLSAHHTYPMVPHMHEDGNRVPASTRKARYIIRPRS